MLLRILFSLALVDAGYCHLVAEIGLNTMLWLSFKMFPADKVVKRLLVFYCENKTAVTVAQKFEGLLSLLRQSKSPQSAITSWLWRHCASHPLFSWSHKLFQCFAVQ